MSPTYAYPLNCRRFTEYATSKPRNIDKENGIIYSVRICGKFSRNNRYYSEQVLRQAIPLYEGVKVFIDHSPGGDRSVLDVVGVLRRIRFEDDALHGDLHLRRNGRHFEEVLELAEGFSGMVGLSHVADGDCRMRGGREEVLSITEVFSVDLVTNPATNAGMYENTGGGMAPDLDSRHPMTAEPLPSPRQEEIERLLAVAKEVRQAVTEAVKEAYRLGDDTALHEDIREVRQLVQEFKDWLSDSAEDDDHKAAIEELDSIMQTVNDLLLSPTAKHAPRGVENALEDLEKLVGSASRGAMDSIDDEPVKLTDRFGESYFQERPTPAEFAESFRRLR